MFSLPSAQGCAFEMGWPVVVESEDISAFAAQALRVRDRAAVRTLIVIGLAPLFDITWSYSYNLGGLTSGWYNISQPLLSLTSCKLHTVVQVLVSSQPTSL